MTRDRQGDADGGGRWDYIVVGAGSAGAVVAARLSADPSARVLLLEAGPDYRTAETPSALYRALNYAEARQAYPELWWGELEVRRNSSQPPREYGRGRGMGGSSAVNGMFAIRGTPEDYDLWAAGGADGWSFEDVLPALRRLEDEHDFPDADYHGVDGPIPIFRQPEDRWGPLDLALRNAALELGYGWADDYNAPTATGASPYAFTIRDGRRVSTNDGYLEPARDRTNLRIEGGTLVDLVLFDHTGTRASGVRTADGADRLLERGGEVVLSAGAVHSPAILMRSGVGPLRYLTALGIGVAADLPVGQRVQEHPLLTMQFPMIDQPPAESRSPMVCLRYTSGLDDSGPNDMMILTGAGYKIDTARAAGAPSARAHGGLRLWVTRSFSNGLLEIVSRDPSKHPAVDLRLLSDRRDASRMEDGVRRIAELLAQPMFAAIMTAAPRLPERSELPLLVGDGYSGHISSTCPMGRADGDWTVVDAECRVLGIEGLRVIDASAMPEVPRSNINLSVIMLAEHAVERMIRS